MGHLTVLRHLLVKIKTGFDGFQVANLLCCESQRSLDEFLRLHAREYACAPDRLAKTGLETRDRDILVIGQRRWNDFSQMHCVTKRLPSTTNSIQSFHGDLNSQTACRHPFVDAANP
jgi:hypothetical protein